VKIPAVRPPYQNSYILSLPLIIIFLMSNLSNNSFPLVFPFLLTSPAKFNSLASRSLETSSIDGSAITPKAWLFSCPAPEKQRHIYRLFKAGSRLIKYPSGE
ncbi:hypothetical protein, partial [Mailhella massiliensis]